MQRDDIGDDNEVKARANYASARQSLLALLASPSLPPDLRLHASATVAALEQYTLSSPSSPSPPTDKPMDDTVVSSNPYSRLMALQRMGIVPNYAAIRSKTVAIVGVGGVGSVAAEMLTRCGVGKLLLFDNDIVEAANMNRLFYRPSQASLPKVSAAAATLTAINPDVTLETHNADITSLTSFPAFQSRLRTAAPGGAPVDIVLACVDNYSARLAVNAACNEDNIPWLESGVSEDAVSGHVQLMLPGRTACFACAPPLVVASGIDEASLKRDGVCAASLPTTMGIVSGLLVQNALKFLLGFGEVAEYVGYSALQDFFPKMRLRPSPACHDKWCLKRQRSEAGSMEEERVRREALEKARERNADVVDLHPENEWGISVGVDDKPEQGSAAGSGQIATDEANEPVVGLKFAYEPPEGGQVAEADTVDVNGSSVNDLMAQLRGL